MAGFSDLLERIDQTDAAMARLQSRVGGSDLEQARAEVERLKAALESIAPERASGMLAQLAQAEERVKLLESRGGGADSPASSPVHRVSFQMGRMTEKVKEEAEEAERVLDELDEKSEEVHVKISKRLAAILDPGNGEGVSGRWDPDTKQFLGGALSNERARDLVDRYIELREMQKGKLTAFEQFYVNESINKTAQQFRVEFAKLGDIKSLAKLLRDYMAIMAKNEKPLGPTSGVLGRETRRSQPSTSLAVARWSGGLR